MRRIHRSAIVPYPAVDMFELVADIESYSEFLPWCTRGRVERDTVDSEPGGVRTVVARLDLAQGGVTGHFTTRNRLELPRRITMSLVEGSFRELEGVWEIEMLGEQGILPFKEDKTDKEFLFLIKFLIDLS